MRQQPNMQTPESTDTLYHHPRHIHTLETCVVNPSSWSHEVKLPLEDEGILIPQKEGGIAKSFSMESMVPDTIMNDEVL